MDGAVKFLSDDALLAAAAYYASLDPAQPIATKAAPVKADALSAGKAAASGCAGCHGETGVSKTSGVPSLVGQDPAYLVVAMNAYKAGQRKDDMMKTLVGGLSDRDMKNIALFYAFAKTRSGANTGRRRQDRRQGGGRRVRRMPWRARRQLAVRRRQVLPARTEIISWRR